MNVEPKAETRNFETEVSGKTVTGTVTQYLDGMFNPDDPSFKGVRYTVNVVFHGTRYKFTMFYENGEWHTRLLSVFGDDEIKLASLETFINHQKKVENLFEDSLMTLDRHVPERPGNDEAEASILQ